MNETITAIYENGGLRPITPLALPEHTKVQLWIQSPPLGDQAETHRREVVAALVAAGLTLPTRDTSPVLPLSEAERDDLARRIPAGRPHPESDAVLETRIHQRP
jgi:predicted DNA-binding antitoxin AbrB/MazE fold protein